jgi:hypothetical protein
LLEEGAHRPELGGNDRRERGELAVMRQELPDRRQPGDQLLVRFRDF